MTAHPGGVARDGLGDWRRSRIAGDRRPGTAVRRPVAGSCRAGIVATDGDMTPMGPSSGSSVSDRPADAYARLWESGAPTPDVFAFLATRPGLTPEDRLEVLLIK